MRAQGRCSSRPTMCPLTGIRNHKYTRQEMADQTLIEVSEGFDWNDSFLLGHPPMDAVHQEFVETLGHLLKCDDAATPAALADMARHLEEHFSAENQWMKDSEFPARECHVEQHDAVLNSVHQVQALVAQGDLSRVKSLATALVEWFPGHADYLDAALSHWLCKRKLGGKPVVLRRNVTGSPLPDNITGESSHIAA